MALTLEYSPEVRDALDSKRPVVALESTIISHGMPFPQNLEVAIEVEEKVRKQGATPATIAILDGVIHIGLNQSRLEKFASLQGVMKCSRRDLPYALARRLNGATTVAATMILADLAGIKVFATGGIGGVHRGAENTLDISADLMEFSRTPVMVVSAGAKAILDLPKTMEYLETMGVPVIGFKTDDFPAFYTRTSGLKVPMRFDHASEIAAFTRASSELGYRGGSLIANPIPDEFAMDSDLIEKAIQQAISKAELKGISGKELTPFLLKHLNELTEGKSQIANKALVLNNALVAADIAVELCKSI
jgi:pseudouridine-5'-phosphate glycosidase